MSNSCVDGAAARLLVYAEAVTVGARPKFGSAGTAPAAAR